MENTTPTPLDVMKTETGDAPAVGDTQNTDVEQNTVVEQGVATEPDTDDAPAVDDEPAGETAEQGDMFPRSYVEKLRKESARLRERSKGVDELQHRLHDALVKLDGRLADPADLEFNADHLDDAEALAAAIDDLVTKKPGLRARQLSGDVGQGARGSTPAGVNLIEMMRRA